MAEAQIIDMREVFSRHGRPRVFSEELLAAITENQRRKEQSIILLNRRGFSSFVLCRSCGETIKCPNCDVTLTYHRSERVIICHYCNHRQPPPSQCPNCEKNYMHYVGEGTEQIEDDVEIGAGATIDRASVGETRIGRGTKIDNLVQIGHSCTIGQDSLLCAQVGLAGSSRIGNRVVLAGQAGVAGHLTIGDDAVITAKSATSHDVPPGKMISGIPAFDNREWLRSTAAFRRLGDMQKKIRELEQRLLKLESGSRESSTS